MNVSTKFGLTMLVIGFILLSGSYLGLSSGYYFPKLIALGGVLLFLGIAMLIFPGGEIPEGTPPDKQIKTSFRNAPITNKIMWFFLPAVGLALSIWWIDTLGGF